MDFQFYQVEEEEHYNVCNNTFTFEARVFKSIRLNKDNYKLRKPQQVFDDLSYFLNMRVEYCKNNYKGYCENNFSVNFDFSHLLVNLKTLLIYIFLMRLLVCLGISIFHQTKNFLIKSS